MFRPVNMSNYQINQILSVCYYYYLLIKYGNICNTNFVFLYVEKQTKSIQSSLRIVIFVQ